MVQWFSQRWTEDDPKWTSLFNTFRRSEEKIDGCHAYRPISPSTVNVFPDDVEEEAAPGVINILEIEMERSARKRPHRSARAETPASCVVSRSVNAQFESFPYRAISVYGIGILCIHWNRSGGSRHELARHGVGQRKSLHRPVLHQPYGYHPDEGFMLPFWLKLKLWGFNGVVSSYLAKRSHWDM